MTGSPSPLRSALLTLHGGQPRRSTASTRIAAIDIGSNSIRQIVADVTADGAIHVVDEMKAAPRLGTGLDASGVLQDEAIDRAIDALGHMATLAKQLNADRVDVVATSAVRDATNAPEFLSRVARVTGLKVRVLDGEEEARLGFRSAVAHFELGAGRAAVLDIGGGSLEIALSADGILERLASLPFGAVRMTERFFSNGSTRRAVQRLRNEVATDIRREISVRDWRGAQVIGSGGTFTNLAGIVLARQGMSSARNVHDAVVQRGELEHVLDMLAEMTVDERKQVPGLNAARADIIVAGLAVAAEVLARIEARQLRVSRYGIREGLLLEAARVAPVVADPGEARQRSVDEFAERCHVEWVHAKHVRHLAVRLFDQLGARLGCDGSDRALLADAALLHDVGYHINYDRHHKHSYHLILHAELLGMTPVDQVIIANVARYHRGGSPKKVHRNFGLLEKSVRKRIRALSALLRIADGLDRGHIGAVSDVKVRWMSRAIRITPVPSNARHALRLELWGAHRKSKLLAKVVGIPVEIVSVDGSVLSSESLRTADSGEGSE